MGVVGRLDQYASMLAGEFDDYSMSENLLTYSEQFTDASWNKGNCTITANQTTAPDGTLTAYSLIENTTSGAHAISKTISKSASPVTYTFSVFAKLKDTRNIQLILSSASSGSGVTVNLNTGALVSAPVVFGSFTNVSAKVVPYLNGWYSVQLTVTSESSGTLTATIYSMDGSSGIYLGNGTSGIYIWRAQLETGSVATDYTPTTTTAISRVLPATTNTNITGLGTYYSSGFDENVGFATFLSANVFAPYDPVYDEFSGTSFGAGQGRYMRQNTDKSVIVYNEIDEVTDFRDIVRSGMVLDLDAGINSSYNGSGTTWIDLSGIGNNGTLVNTPTYNTSGYFTFSYLSTQSVSFNSSSSLQFLDRLPYTLEAWVYPTRNPGANNWTGIFDRESNPGSGRDGYNMYFLGSATTDTFFFTERFTSGSYNAVPVTLNQSITVNNWHHVVGTYDGTTLTLYRNGSSVGTPVTTTGNITNTSKSLTVGVRGGQYFDGRISNAKTYNRALTAAEVSQNFNALRNRFGL